MASIMTSAGDGSALADGLDQFADPAAQRMFENLPL
jgi:hypothetical protein